MQNNSTGGGDDVVARARSPNRDKAFEIYKENKGDITNRKIAEILGEDEKKVAVWKQRDKWDKNSNVVQQSKSKVVQQKKKRKPSLKDEMIIEQLEDADLTEKQRLFCLYYIKSFNATMAAIKAGYAKDSAHVEGSRLLRNPKVVAEIKRLKGVIQQEVFIDAMDILNRYIKIAFADITDYVKFGRKRVHVMGMYGPVYEKIGDDKIPVMQTINYIDLKESTEIDGTVLSEVSEGKDGVKIKLADKMKALEKLEKYFDLFPDQFKRKIEEEKLQIAKAKLELEKTKVNGDEGENEDDGFLEALEGKVSEVWDDAEED